MNLSAYQTAHPRVYAFLRRWSLRGLSLDFSPNVLKSVARKFGLHPKKLQHSIQVYKKYYQTEAVSKPECVPTEGGDDE